MSGMTHHGPCLSSTEQVPGCSQPVTAGTAITGASGVAANALPVPVPGLDLLVQVQISSPGDGCTTEDNTSALTDAHQPAVKQDQTS